jgi:ribose transport system ATP-binding protein
MEVRPNLEAINIRKAYPGTVALKGLSLSFMPGEVHALIGKNGAGKSSLVKILSGAIQPTSGSIQVAGQVVELRSPRDAFQKGIATVYQELSLVPGLTVAHNMLLADLPTKFSGLCIDWRMVHARAAAILESLNLDIDPGVPVRSLGMAGQQMVEIAKAMSFQPKVLMLDEPTSSLANDETDSLFRLIQELAEKGVSIVYISHRLQELKRIAHKVSVLRDGELVGTIPIEEAEPSTIAHMMFGEVVPRHRPANLKAGEGTVLELRNINRSGKLHDVSFSLNRGEILGIAGLVGAGRTELLRTICGADRADSGEILVEGKVIAHPTPGRMKDLGIGLTPENRKEEGLVLNLSIRENICLACLRRISWRGLIWKARQEPVVNRNVEELQIRLSSAEDPVATLSGGNQQKVVVGKWLNIEPRILLLDEPTRGIDIQAKQQIFQLIWDLSQKGISTLFVSSELEELVDVCHRILILRDGRLSGEVAPESVTPQKLFEYCVDADALVESVSHG